MVPVRQWPMTKTGCLSIRVRATRSPYIPFCIQRSTMFAVDETDTKPAMYQYFG